MPKTRFVASSPSPVEEEGRKEEEEEEGYLTSPPPKKPITLPPSPSSFSFPSTKGHFGLTPPPLRPPRIHVRKVCVGTDEEGRKNLPSLGKRARFLPGSVCTVYARTVVVRTHTDATVRHTDRRRETRACMCDISLSALSRSDFVVGGRRRRFTAVASSPSSEVKRDLHIFQSGVRSVSV